MRGVIVAAPSSGSGKTAFTQALIRYLVHQGRSVIPAKLGPDYIDPQFLSLAANRSHGCVNLDSWAMRDGTLPSAIALAEQQTPDALWVIEGAMGLFDGAADGTGSPADIAEKLDLPIILVVNAAKQSASVAALVQGFVRHRPHLRFAGLVINQVASERHQQLLHNALAEHCPKLAVLGFVHRDESWHLPERHLGLVQAGELVDHHARLDRMAMHLSKSFDQTVFDAALAQQQGSTLSPSPLGLLPAPEFPLAIAHDLAFGFVYAAQVWAWQQRGEVSFFSPLADEAPPPEAKTLFLPGGYPELYAEQLNKSKNFQQGMHAAARRDVWIYGECGGYMALGESLEDPSGQVWEMLGLLPVRFHFHQRAQALGYRQIRLLCDHVWGRQGAEFRGHEFHYAKAEILDPKAQLLFYAEDALGKAYTDQGLIRGRVSGSFMHLIDTYVVE